VLFKKEWHHPDSKLLEQARLGWKKGVRFTTCPACMMIKNHTYEGEVIIRNIPKKFEGELFRLITAYCTRATKRDPQDRVIAIKKQRGGYRVTTTEDELAVKLAKKIK